MTRTLSAIVDEIRSDHWNRGKALPFAAVPYLDAMRHLQTLDQMYYADSADSIVRYALSNLTTWRGETAKRIKAELHAMLKAHGK